MNDENNMISVERDKDSEGLISGGLVRQFRNPRETTAGDVEPTMGRNSRVNELCMSLDDEVTELHSALTRLENVLAPVLGPEKSDSTKSMDGGVPDESKLSTFLREEGAQVQAARRRITSVLDRIEL